jgi:hypothetical protein
VPSAAQTKCEATAKHGRLTTPKPTEAVKGLFRGFQSKDFATQEAVKTEEDSSAQDELDALKETKQEAKETKSLTNMECPLHSSAAANKNVIKVGQKQLQLFPEKCKACLQQIRQPRSHIQQASDSQKKLKSQNAGQLLRMHLSTPLAMLGDQTNVAPCDKTNTAP